MDFFETGVFDMGIDLCGGDAGMAQHHLNRPKIRSMIQQMGGKRMPEHVRRDGFANPGSSRAVLEDFPKTLSAHGPT